MVMNNKQIKRLMTILVIGTILFACSTSSDKNSNQENQHSENNDRQKNLSDKDPEVILAIIQEGTNPPSEQLVQSFGELLNSLKGYYSDITTKDMSDKLAMAYDLAAQKGNNESLHEFIYGFSTGVENSIKSNVRYDFSELLANYACYKTNCDNVNAEMVKYFDLAYVKPSQKSQYVGKDFVLIENIETFRIRFNNITKGSLNPIRTTDILVHDGNSNDPGKAFEITLSTDFYVVGGLNKEDNSINSLSLIIGTDNSLEEAASFLLGVVAIIASTNPDLKPAERGDIMKKVGLSDKANINPENVKTTKTIKDGIEYSFTVIPEQGILFHASKPSK